MAYETPVAFIIFNRPDTTARVFAEIARAQPKKLLVIADGPRADRPEDVEKCAAARAVLGHVDWDCEVLTNYSEVNLGCGIRVATGIDWVFELVEEAIILEDDCLPHPSFFRYCQELLEKYRDDEEVMHIGGTNLIPRPLSKDSVFFCRFTAIWGWATWRRAWKLFDYRMGAWHGSKKKNALMYFGSQQRNVYKIFDKQRNNRSNDVWDAQWWFTCLHHNGLGIVPKVNLVRNIGFGPDATHTVVANPKAAASVEELSFPLVIPLQKRPQRQFDIKYLQCGLGDDQDSIRCKISNNLKKLKIRISSLLGT